MCTTNSIKYAVYGTLWVFKNSFYFIFLVCFLLKDKDISVFQMCYQNQIKSSIYTTSQSVNIDHLPVSAPLSSQYLSLLKTSFVVQGFSPALRLFPRILQIFGNWAVWREPATIITSASSFLKEEVTFLVKLLVCWFSMPINS